MRAVTREMKLTASLLEGKECETGWKRAIVTGAAAGIGTAIALAPADEGAGVAPADIHGTMAESVAEALSAKG